MAGVDPEVLDDEPLDPAVENVRRKMVRLMSVSVGIMLAGIAAVLFAIVYKMNEASTPRLSNADLLTPKGFVTRSVSSSENRITLFGTAADGGQHVLVFDIDDGRLIFDGAIKPASE